LVSDISGLIVFFGVDGDAAVCADTLRMPTSNRYINRLAASKQPLVVTHGNLEVALEDFDGQVMRMKMPVVANPGGLILKLDSVVSALPVPVNHGLVGVMLHAGD
jgi:hypothetical protein